MTVSLRPAQPEDVRYVWETNNDPTVRSQAVHASDIPWENHVGWYRDRLARTDTRLMIAMEGSTAVGVARLDLVAGEAVVTIAMGAHHRGRGLGSRVIGLVSEQALAQSDIVVAVAYIRPGNIASQRAFRKNGYRQMGTANLAGNSMLRFEKAREAAHVA